MKIRSITLDVAMSELKKTDDALHAAKTVVDRRSAAIAFANAERVARSAKKRESNGSLLDSLGNTSTNKK